jgi:peptidoglycan/LPS O-acetylase OafA/YrhL
MQPARESGPVSIARIVPTKFRRIFPVTERSALRAKNMRLLAIRATTVREQVKVKKDNTGYIRTLDGWRAIAVWAVIFHHSRASSLGSFDLSPIRDFCDHGVQLFFAISGLLICSRLLEERALNGRISLKGFYIRRVFRIQPAAIVYLLVLGTLGLTGIIPQSALAWVSSLLCFRNIHAALNWPTLPGDRYTVHYWSLAVEEHFYLFLPMLLLLARKNVRWSLGILSALFFFWAPFADHFGLAESPLSAWRTDISLRYLIFAAFLAALIAQPVQRLWFTKLTAYGIPIVVVVGGILVSQRFLNGHGTNELCCLGFPLMVLSTMLHPQGWLGRLMETWLFSFLGRISYSLYLWQMLFFVHRSEPSIIRYVQNTPWNLLVLMICAMSSYYFIEKPLIRFGHKLAPPATPGRADLSEHRNGSAVHQCAS